MPVKHGGEHFQRVRIDILIDIAQHRRLVSHDHHRQIGRRFQRQAADAPLFRFGLRFALRQRTRRQRSIVLLGQLEHRLMLDIADDNQKGVVRHVPALVPVARVLHRHAFQVVHPADHRRPVRVGLKSDGQHLFIEQ